MRVCAGNKKTMKEKSSRNRVLWLISVILIIFWLLGLMIDDLTDPFIHVLCAAAIILLVIGINREASLNRKLRHMSRSRG